MVVLNKQVNEKEMALCCGSSLAILPAGFDDKEQMAFTAVTELCQSNPEKLITACPLCKKTFTQACNDRKLNMNIEVKDISELLAEAVN
jgi:Fe-S oxidoreductase